MALTSAEVVLRACANPGTFLVHHAMTANSAGTQVLGTPLRANVHAFVVTSGGGREGGKGSCQLPSLVDNEAGRDFIIVANLTAASIDVFPAVGDTINKVLNTALTVTAGGFAIFVKKRVETYPFVAGDWQSAVVDI